MEGSGHLEGMLDRDQRTAKLRFYPQTYADVAALTSNIPQEDAASQRPCRCASRSRRHSGSGHLPSTFQSVTNVLIVICLTFAMLPSSSTAPVDRMKLPEKWKNPCDFTGDGNTGDSSSENVNLEVYTSAELKTVSDTVDKALTQAKDLRDQFVTNTFGGRSIEDVHSFWKDETFSFLLSIPKTMGENIPKDVTLMTEEVLSKAYDTLQHIAVGLEQITWNQQDNGSEFFSKFNESELHLKRVLCELSHVMNYHKIKVPTPVERDIMAEDVRTLDDTGRMRRDWIIFRDYINALEYLTQALEQKIASLS